MKNENNTLPIPLEKIFIQDDEVKCLIAEMVAACADGISNAAKQKAFDQEL